MHPPCKRHIRRGSLSGTGEAVALNAGELITEVLEIVDNGMKIAILDTSAACHMPDVLEMPYRPPLKGAASTEDADLRENKYVYRLAGPTCLAGDVIGDYVFDHPLQCGGAVGISGYGDLYHGKDKYV